ncbi:pyruvate ferredoxin oxidoreductase [Candidatus Bathyarchaeota archaeon]|nr:MAG: pyruvate ferredoxin oxidoreductase [Candidatus Bathyarchaeota archaeon]
MYFGSGHSACPGCALPIAVKSVLNALEGKCFVVNSTGCLEIISSQYGRSAWGVPYIHSLFENAAAVAAGIEAALEVLNRKDEGHVVVFAGDGATADIGIGPLSGMFDRGHDVLYVCLDNEAYQNTGNQQSGLTPPGSRTTTTPVGKLMPGKIGRKKDMISIAVAHRVPYVATASVAYPRDIMRKAKKAVEFKGPKYLQIHCPCVTGWGLDSRLVIKVAKLAIETGLYPIVEFENGQLTRVMKIKRKPVEEYLKLQRRFKHLFKHPKGDEILGFIQEIADENAKRYGLDI